MSDIEFINEEVRKIIDSGRLGRSAVYLRLLSYLALCTSEGRNAKEIEIAADVFDKGSEFDSNQDSLVRVYIHNLRQKLNNYYAAQPKSDNPRLSIPKGEYRLEVKSPSTDHIAISSLQLRPTHIWLAAVATLLIVNVFAIYFYRSANESDSKYASIARSPIWTGVLQEDNPLLIVVGDYYIFAELDTDGNITRMIREFDINSSADLGQLLSFDPNRPNDYIDLNLTYLPQGTASALKDLLRVVYTSAKKVKVIPSSELRAHDLKSNDILYVGYISALGVLEDFVFSESSLRIGETYDEILHKETGSYYRSTAGMPGQNSYRDFGLISTFPGPGDNQIMIVAGTRDSGLMQTAQVLVSGADVQALEAALDDDNAKLRSSFEALFEVTGFDRMNLNAKLIHTSKLEYRQIWSTDFVYQNPDL